MTTQADIVTVLHHYHVTTAKGMIASRMFDAESLDTVATTARAASLTCAHTAKDVAFQMAAALREIERILLNEEEYARPSLAGQEAIRLANSLAVVAIGGVMDLFVKEDDVSVRYHQCLTKLTILN
jgi:hypothetical protein